MRQYEITFIIDPVLPGDEANKAAKSYETLLSEEGASIVNVDNMGLKQLAYPINKKNSGVYKCIEFQSEHGAMIPKVELAMRRDERIMRFLTVKLDKYAVKYNEDKRNGLIGSAKKSKDSDKKDSKDGKPAYRVAKDDLTLIEGVGPKASKLLTTAGINTYAKLSGATPSEIKEILSKGGPAFKTMDPGTWPDQAQLAADGKWSQLNAMKEKLVGGKAIGEEE
jgi:small subunit ribosomal protein S6